MIPLPAVVVVAALLSSAGDELSRGRELVMRQCASCHSIEPDRDIYKIILRDGPPLVHAGSKFRRDWLVAWLQSPRRIRPAGYLAFRYVVAAPDGDRIAERVIPSHPVVQRGEAEAIASWLSSQRRALTPAPPLEGPPVDGRLHFEKILGCAGCHRLGDNGGLSAPELATANDRLDPQWMQAFAADPVPWAPATMPKISMRSNQLHAVVDFLKKHGLSTALSNRLQPTDARTTPSPIPPERSVMLYQLHCSPCHGVRGNGKGINASYLFVAPRDHTSSAEMGMLTEDRVFAAIKFGGTAVGKSSLMPAWNGTIADPDIRLLADYVRALSGGSAP